MRSEHLVSPRARRYAFSALAAASIVAVVLLAPLAWGIARHDVSVLAQLRTPAPTPRVSEAAAVPSLPPPVTSINWVMPHAGDLYVVTNDLQSSGGLLLVDIEKGTVSPVATLGANPAIALAPNGSAIILISSEAGADLARALRLADGEITATASLRDRMVTLHPARTMAASADGRYLHLMTLSILAPGVDQEALVTVDLLAASRVVSRVDLAGCGVGKVHVMRSGVAAACRQTLHLIHGPDSPAPSVRSVRVDGRSPSDPVVGAAVTRDGSVAYVATRDGAVLVVDALRGVVLDSRTLRLSPGATVRPDGLTLSPTGQLLLLISAADERAGGVGSEIIVLDSTDLSTLVSARTRAVLTTISASADGTHIFGLERATGTLRVYSAADGRQVRVIPGLGNAAWALRTVP